MHILYYIKTFLKETKKKKKEKLTAELSLKKRKTDARNNHQLP